MLDYRPSRRLRAALTLAAVYATGVTLLLATLLFTTDSPRVVLEMLPLVSIPGAVCFAAAFLLLAMARRAGFMVLWVVVFGFWIWGALQGPSPFAASIAFVYWSLLAAPLYAMCATGFPRQSAQPRWRHWMSITVLPLWAVLAVMAVRQFGPIDEPMRRLYVDWLALWLRCAWLVTPSAVTLAGIVDVYHRAPTGATSRHA